MERELLTISEVAEYLKVSKRTACLWCKAGKLPAFKVGHEWRITLEDLDRTIRRQMMNHRPMQRSIG